MTVRERLLQLLGSGELQRMARECRSETELASRVGVTRMSYEASARRMRNAGIAFPRFRDLLTTSVVTPQGNVVKGVEQTETTVPATPVVAPQPPRIMSLAEDIAQRKLRAENASLKSRLAEAIEELEHCKLQLSTVVGAEEARFDVPPIVPRERTSVLREATAVALASDWHIEESVDADAVNGVNEYNLQIAQKRVERFFGGFTYLIRYHQDHFKIRDALLWLGGDLITGYLREENLEANELSPVQAIATLHVWLATGIRSVLDTLEIERLHIVCNSGNHGRLTEKTRPSTREANSIEWLLYVGLAREFQNEPRVVFTLPKGSQTYVDVYDWTIRFTHGDDAKFGGGVGGIMIPLKKAIARWQTYKPAHLTCLGHFHQYHDLSNLVVNGSLIGYNPYALSIGAEFEAPRQAFFLIDTKRGKTMPADIWVTE